MACFLFPGNCLGGAQAREMLNHCSGAPFLGPRWLFPLTQQTLHGANGHLICIALGTSAEPWVQGPALIRYPRLQSALTLLIPLLRCHKVAKDLFRGNCWRLILESLGIINTKDSLRIRGAPGSQTATAIVYTTVHSIFISIPQG